MPLMSKRNEVTPSGLVIIIYKNIKKEKVVIYWRKIGIVLRKYILLNAWTCYTSKAIFHKGLRHQYYGGHFSLWQGSLEAHNVSKHYSPFSPREDGRATERTAVTAVATVRIGNNME